MGAWWKGLSRGQFDGDRIADRGGLDPAATDCIEAKHEVEPQLLGVEPLDPAEEIARSGARRERNALAGSVGEALQAVAHQAQAPPSGVDRLAARHQQRQHLDRPASAASPPHGWTPRTSAAGDGRWAMPRRSPARRAKITAWLTM